MRRLLTVVSVLALLLVPVGCKKNENGLRRFERTYLDTFDTVVQLIAYDTDEAAFAEKAEQIHRELQRYDALYDMLGAETFQKYQERGAIEVAPLAYMRGRTLDDSFIILDEAQNTTKEQMKMFLTRLGFGSKVVITGDVTQIDLPSDKTSGLKDALRVLDGIKDIAICRLTSADVVRHALVQEIINAYEKAEKKRDDKQETRKNINQQRK